MPESPAAVTNPLAVLIDADNASPKIIESIDLFEVVRKEQHVQIRPKPAKA